MAVESSLSKDLISRNRVESEPKKKLKKTRSIQLSKVASLKPSSRRSKSRFSWLSIDFPTDALDFPDSTPNYMKPTNSSDAKKDFSQGGSEIDDTTSVGSSSYESLVNGLSPLNKATKIQKAPKTYGSSRSFRKRVKSRIVHEPPVVSSNDADGSPRYFTGSSGGRKVNSHKASPRNSESSFDRSDENSLSSQKSLHTLVRTPSVRIIMNKTSFKHKRSSLKRGQVSEDLNVDRATCSSTLKGKRFTEPSESLKNETTKVCPYNHCSLHGHRHAHETPPPPPPKRSLYKKGRSVKSSGSRKKDFPISKVSPKVEGSSQEVGVSGAILAPLMDGKDVSFSIEIYAKLRAHVSPKAVEIPLGESSYHGESLNQMMSLIKSISDLKENSAGCSCKTKVDISSSVSTEVESEVTASTVDDEDQESAVDDGNSDHSLAISPDVKSDDTRSQNDANLNGESRERELSTVAKVSVDCDEAAEDKSMINSSDVVVSGPNHGGDSEPGDSSREGNRAKVNKNKNMSMWHMIHRHMASTLASSADTKPLEKADEGKQVDDNHDINPLSETTEKLSDLNIASENRETINQDLELRKAFAIKIVREAIEKILLPEIPDQASDDLSVTSDAMSEQDLSEKNHESLEGSERKGDDNASVDVEESSRNAVQENEKRETRVEKESDKKAPKHWSNLKKWIILQRFVKALEKVRKFNPSKPQLLELEADPEAEKVSLRPQTVEDKKRTEEWMLDYALRQAVDQLAPTQKKKVALLVKAFETVVPPQEDSGFRFSFSKLKVTSDESPRSTKNVDESVNKNEKFGFLRGGNVKPIFKTQSSSSADDGEPTVSSEITSSVSENISLTSQKETSEESFVSEVKTQGGNEKSETTYSSDVIVQQGTSGEETNEKCTVDVNNNEEDKKNQIKMWHMVYQHVVSSIAEKVGSELLDGTDDETEETTNQEPRSGFSRSEAVRLVQEAVDEILLPETQSKEEEKTPKSKNWSKLKKHILLRRSINALQKAGNVKSPLMANPEPEKVDLRNQMMDERKKAEQWMLDYAVQHIVHKLTPARKLRVAMLVEAFEAVVPLPEI